VATKNITTLSDQFDGALSRVELNETPNAREALAI
jgi:hypothetical protein